MARGTRQAYCRVCHAAYRRAHYLANRQEYIDREMTRNRGYHRENRRRIREYLESRGCIDCGEGDRRVLDFDHRDPETKFGNVARLATTRPWRVVLREIEKCDVRCANCHRRRTALQFDWLKRRRGLPSGS